MILTVLGISKLSHNKQVALINYSVAPSVSVHNAGKQLNVIKDCRRRKKKTISPLCESGESPSAWIKVLPK